MYVFVFVSTHNTRNIGSSIGANRGKIAFVTKQQKENEREYHKEEKGIREQKIETIHKDKQREREREGLSQRVEANVKKKHYGNCEIIGKGNHRNNRL